MIVQKYDQLLLKYLKYYILFFSFQCIIAQKEATHWYFGEKAGLNFSSGVPVANAKGALVTEEGCATISDSNGKLLFYTDGTKVWNRSHRVMPTGSELLGNSSSTQSAIIVPKPDDNNIYYVFTVDWGGGFFGLNYYTIDMTLEGGFGDVVSANGIPEKILLLESPTSEKITAVKAFDDNAFWVISLKDNRFYVYKVDQNGVNSTEIDGNDGFNLSRDLRGYLKTSPDGTMLISANMSSGTFLYDFDDKTGLISNERRIDVEGKFSYGVEFSPQSKKLYVSTGNFDPDGIPQEECLYQFTVDMPLLTSANINATRIKIHSYNNLRGALQVGLDGKIYRAIEKQSFLGVINNPELDGLAVNYIHEAIDLGSRISRQGLPPFIQSFFIANINVQDQCLGDETSFEINSNEPIEKIIWDFGDGSGTSTELKPTHVYAASGDYNVTVIVTGSEETKTINQTITIFDLPNVVSPIVLQQCDDDNDGITSFNLHQSEELISSDVPTPNYSFHLNLLDAEENSNPIIDTKNFSNAVASQIFVRVENQLNCHTIVDLNLQVSTTQIPEDFMLPIHECDDDLIDGDDNNGITTFDFSSATQDILDLFPANQNLIVTYYENIEDALALLNEIDSSSFRNENSPFSQQIVVRVDNENNNACVGLGYHIALIVNPLPEFDLIDLQFLCLNELPNPLVIQVENAEGDYTYQWRNANGDLLVTNKTSILKVKEKGDYFVTAITDNNCERTKKVTVEVSEIAQVLSVDIVDVTENNTITIHVNGVGEYEYSLNDIYGPYQDENYFDGLFGGTHTIYVRDKNGCGIQEEEVIVLNIPKFFTPNNDGINDVWIIDGVFSQPYSKIYVFDKFGKVLKKIETDENGWDGTYRGNQMPSTDYWYHVQLDDGRDFKGHFSLIRR